MNDYSLKKTLFQLLDLPIAVAKRFRSDRLTRHAAALSFSSMLALAPMMAIGFAVLSVFSSTSELSAPLEDFFYQFLLPTASEELRGYIDQFSGQAGKLSLIGLGFFLLTALLLLFNIEESFNDIWRVEQGRNMTARLIVYWALVSLGPLLMGASLAISTYLLSLTVTTGAEFVGQFQSFGVILLPFLFELLAFMLLYLVMPNVRVSLLHALGGALVASLMFEVTKKGFALYVLNFKSYEIVYGALSTLPIFLIWIYLSWVVALIGAEVVAVLQQRSLEKRL
jgi:membrane protein